MIVLSSWLQGCLRDMESCERWHCQVILCWIFFLTIYWPSVGSRSEKEEWDEIIGRAGGQRSNEEMKAAS